MFQANPVPVETLAQSVPLHPAIDEMSLVASPFPSRAVPLNPTYNAAIQDHRMTFGYFVETKFIPDHVSHKRTSGQIHYRSILKHLVRPENVNEMFGASESLKPKLNSVPDWPYLDDVPLCDLRPDRVRAILAAAVAKDYSPQTIKHIRNVMNSVISHAQREGCFIGPNPVSVVKLPPLVPRVDRHVGTRALREMFGMMEYPEKHIAKIAIATGMTILEICGLRWKHVNLSLTSHRVGEELVPARNIFVSTRWNEAGVGDSLRGRSRCIPMSGQLVTLFKELNRGTYTRPDDFVLTSPQGKAILPASIRMSRLKPIGKKLGMPWLSWSDLRRARLALPAEFELDPDEAAARPGIRGEAKGGNSSLTQARGGSRIDRRPGSETKICCPLCSGRFNYRA